jgi:hypothetical protein
MEPVLILLTKPVAKSRPAAGEQTPMSSLFRKVIIGLMVASTALSAVPASAGERWRDRDHKRPQPVYRDNTGEIIAAGILGVAAGAIIAGIANQPRPVYREPAYRHPQAYPRPSPDRDYFPPAPVRYESDRYASYEPWTREWYRWCANRYRSFDPDYGTYVGYDGVERFCEAN